MTRKMGGWRPSAAITVCVSAAPTRLNPIVNPVPACLLFLLLLLLLILLLLLWLWLLSLPVGWLPNFFSSLFFDGCSKCRCFFLFSLSLSLFCGYVWVWLITLSRAGIVFFVSQSGNAADCWRPAGDQFVTHEEPLVVVKLSICCCCCCCCCCCRCCCGCLIHSCCWWKLEETGEVEEACIWGQMWPIGGFWSIGSPRHFRHFRHFRSRFTAYPSPIETDMQFEIFRRKTGDCNAARISSQLQLGRDLFDIVKRERKMVGENFAFSIGFYRRSNQN